MKFLLKQTAIFILVLALFTSVSYANSVTVGEPAPTFTLLDENGEPQDLKTFIDKPTILYFTHNACHYCTQIIAHLKTAEMKFGKENLRIIGINVMAKDQKLVRAYKEELEFTFPMFAGNKWELLKAYKINYVPLIVFVDAKQIVRKVVGHYIHDPELYDNIREIMGK